MHTARPMKRTSFVVTTALAALAMAPGLSLAATEDGGGGSPAPHAAGSASRTVKVTEANNNGKVSLHPGDTLVVRLGSNVTTGYSWAAVVDPEFPLHLVKHTYITTPQPSGRPRRVGVGGTEEFRFSVPANTKLGGMSMGGWLRMLLLRPFEAGVKDARLWQIKASVES